MKIKNFFLISTILSFASFSLLADEIGDKQREVLLEANEARMVDSFQYNEIQTQIENGEADREAKSTDK